MPGVQVTEIYEKKRVSSCRSLVPIALLAVGAIGLVSTLGLGVPEVALLVVALATTCGFSAARRARLGDR